MDHPFLKAPLPDEFRRAAEDAIGPETGLRLAMPTDVLASGLYGESWLLADEHCVVVLTRDRAEVRCTARHELAGTASIALRDGIGTGSLELTRDSDTTRLLRFSNSRREAFAEAARLLQEWIDRQRWEPNAAELRRAYCPRCGRPLPEDTGSCPSCAEKGHLLRRTLTYLRPYWLPVAGMVGCMTLSTLFGLITPYIGKVFVDDVIKPLENQHWLAPLALCMLLAYVLQTAIEGVSMSLAARVGTFAIYDVRGAAFRRLQELSLSFYSKRQTGSVITRVNQDTEQLHRLMVDFIPYGINMIQLVVGVLALLLFLSVKLTCFVLIPVVAMLLFIRTVFPSFRLVWDRFLERRARLVGYVTDVVTGMRVVKAFGQEAAELQRFDEKSAAFRDVHFAAERRMAQCIPVFHMLAMSGTPLVWFIGGLMVFRGEMTLGTIVAYTGYLMMLFRPIFILSRLAQLIPNALAAAGRVFDILDTEPEIADAPDAVAMPSMRGEVTFDHVEFAYEPGKPVLKDVSFTIAPGELIGLVGHSGAGKSTSINLVCRFYDVNRGCILIDGVDVRKIRYADLRTHIGTVLQETFLLHGSIADNIGYARPDATRAEIVAVARAANAHGFIMKKPDAYDTVVEEGGKNLSAGEKQRISIARALLRNPRILILDEATASVDVETEKEIQDALAKLIQGRTTISIAHRLSTLKNADRLIVLKDGEVCEMGTHAELMAKPDGVFRHLAEMHAELARVTGVGG